MDLMDAFHDAVDAREVRTDVRGARYVLSWYIAALEDRCEIAATALREIEEGKGRFSRDPLTRAGNCIEDMRALATDALAALSSSPLAPTQEGA